MSLIGRTGETAGCIAVQYSATDPVNACTLSDLILAATSAATWGVHVQCTDFDKLLWPRLVVVIFI